MKAKWALLYFKYRRYAVSAGVLLVIAIVVYLVWLR
jgi:hypothetical protein